MKLATYVTDTGDKLGLVIASGVVSISDHLPNAPGSMIELIERWAELRPAITQLETAEADLKLANVVFRAPIPRPGKIMACGLNYKDHIAETKMDTPKYQIWFSKATSAVNGPYDPVELPTVSDALDYEAEMVAIIGKATRNVTGAEAKGAIFGYCVGNDVSVRDWQVRGGQWVVGKSFDSHAPFGPWITTADDGCADNADIRCYVNGELRQASNTRELLFTCIDQVEYLSQAMTLEPGDVIYTGTPGGVGMAFVPPRYLKAGDLIKVEIDGLGYIENRVVPQV